MQYTENLNLNKPETTDYVDVDDLNDNMDTLDEEVDKKVEKVNNTSPDSNHNVTIDPDDLDDTSTTHKFVSSSQITDIADNKTARHTHTNKALLDTYTQVESDLADAVTKKHTHSNKALLDTYTQTESDLASAVTNNHTHSNKSVIDGIASTDITNWNGKEASGTASGLINRSTAVNVADTNYTTYMARGESLNSADTTPTVNGTIAWTYE